MDSYVSFPLLNGYDDFKLSFEIRPEIQDALVLYMNGKSNQDHFAVAIIGGVLQLRFVVKTGHKRGGEHDLNCSCNTIILHSTLEMGNIL